MVAKGLSHYKLHLLMGLSVIQVPVESIETCCSCHQKIHCNRQQDNNYSDSLVTSKNFQACNEWLLHIIF